MKKSLIVMTLTITLFVIINTNQFHQKKAMPFIAIANYGPHETLTATIDGFKKQMQVEGFTENVNIRYKTMDVSFQPTLIAQMIASLQSKKPDILVVLSTPVAQVAKGMVHDTPIVYASIADPVAIGILKTLHQAEKNITGCSDMQDLNAFLEFTKTLLPKAQHIGFLYSTSEANDEALLHTLKKHAKEFKMKVIAIPIDQERDIPVRIQALKNKADFIFTSHSGTIQPALPVIAAEAEKMHIPILNADCQAVRDGLALASHGVSFEQVGKKSGEIAARLLQGTPIDKITPQYLSKEDHKAVINQAIAKKYAIQIPRNKAIEEV